MDDDYKLKTNQDALAEACWQAEQAAKFARESCLTEFEHRMIDYRDLSRTHALASIALSLAYRESR